MPELPEVETIRRDLQGEVVGRKIKSVEVRNGRTVRRHPSAKQFRARLEGHTIKSVDRKGKYLLLGLEDGQTLVVHLGMSGQLQRAKSAKEPKAPHTHAVITFTQGGQLRFVDPRTFGELFVSAAPGEGERPLPELAHLGFDPLEDVMSWERFWALLASRKSGLKALLMDQEFVAGIGNMYADEILFAAGLRFDRLSTSLSSQEVRRLYRSMVETLAEAVKRRGSWPTSSTAISSVRSGTTRTSTRPTTERARRAAVAGPPSSGSSRAGAPPTSATTVRCDRTGRVAGVR
jgi:formamidopyrimidine-DNA glycosylase